MKSAIALAVGALLALSGCAHRTARSYPVPPPPPAATAPATAAPETAPPATATGAPGTAAPAGAPVAAPGATALGGIPEPYTETGVASWYGHPYHGRPAANGEIYDMEKLTAAHRTLPFGTWVEVRNLENNKVVTVRITDRGPFVHGRIIDLSRAAAMQIGMLGPGLAKVRLRVVTPPQELPAVNLYAVQVGAFQDQRR